MDFELILKAFILLVILPFLVFLSLMWLRAVFSVVFAPSEKVEAARLAGFNFKGYWRGILKREHVSFEPCRGLTIRRVSENTLEMNGTETIPGRVL